jgi:hypothetical protein
MGFKFSQKFLRVVFDVVYFESFSNPASLSRVGKMCAGIFNCELFLASTQRRYSSLIFSSVIGMQPMVTQLP